MNCLLSQLSRGWKIIRIFAPEMEKIRFDVVGLYHWDVRDRWKEYAAEAVGRQFVLQPQPENVKDPYAVRAREGSLHVGYVAATDLDAVYQALKGSGRQRLRGIVVESCTEPPVLTVECEVEAIDWAHEPFDDSVYDGWHYDGLPLMPKKVEQLKDLTEDLTEALEGALPIREDALNQGNAIAGMTSLDAITEMTEQLLETNLYDVSREMTRARYRIERLLSARREPALKALADRLRHQKGMLMNHDSRDQVARYLFVELPQTLLRKGFLTSHYTYDKRLDGLESQLAGFPYQLYDKFLNDPVDFLREVYYHHVPRKFLFPLLSGIVLMILKGRVKIERWGREGDTEPIRQIENLLKPESPSDGQTSTQTSNNTNGDTNGVTSGEKASEANAETDAETDAENDAEAVREAKMKQGLKTLLEKTDAQGKLIINQKNLWAAIMCVLVFEYHLTDIDMKAFCRKMDNWGFGKKSGYKNYCDYESIAKDSDYATRRFPDWRGEGTKHGRMVKAAISTREILRPLLGRN